MSFNVTLEESARRFDVRIGYHKVGLVKSYNYKGATPSDDDELYLALRMDESEDDGVDRLGWYQTMEDAVKAILEYSYGSSKITKIVERPV
jgi:hypothetical protein